MQEEAKTIVDGLAVGGGIATIAGWLPDVAALLTIVWLSIRILKEKQHGNSMANKPNGKNA